MPDCSRLNPSDFFVGVDIAELRRFASTTISAAFLNRILSPAEIGIAETLSERRLVEFLAGRFAAKEAVVKALHLKLGDGEVMSEIEVLKAEDGSPCLVLQGSAKAAAVRAGARKGQVSISHGGGMACAVALFLKDAEGESS